MPNKGQLTGMQGVYLVATELVKHGFIASPTSRSTRGVDILVTDQFCAKAFSVQVKTNANNANFWLINEHAKEMVSKTHIYVFVNLNENRKNADLYVVPSKVVAWNMVKEKHSKKIWYWFNRIDAEKYKDGWKIFGKA